MHKSVSILELKKGEKVYQLHLAPDSALGEVHDVLCQMKYYVLERMNKQHQIDQGELGNGQLQPESSV